MKIGFLIISVILTVTAVLPYIKDILKGSTRPNLVSWITWTLLTIVATAAAWAAGERIAALFTASVALETLTIVILGIKKGYVKYTPFDVICQIGALLGFLLWWLFNSPAIAVVASVVIDLIGSLPTIRHAWRNPEEETLFTYELSSLGSFFALLALSTYNWVSLPYVLYVIGINIFVSGTIIMSQRAKAALAEVNKVHR